MNHPMQGLQFPPQIIARKIKLKIEIQRSVDAAPIVVILEDIDPDKPSYLLSAGFLPNMDNGKPIIQCRAGNDPLYNHPLYAKPGTTIILRVEEER